MGGYEPLLFITLRGRAVEEGRVSVDSLVSVLRDVQLCVRRMGVALASDPSAVAPLVSPAVLWRSCALDVVGFDKGSLCIQVDIPNEIKISPWPRYHGQPLAVAALGRFLDLITHLEKGPRAAKTIPTELLPPLRRIARVFDRGIGEITFSGFAAQDLRVIAFHDTARWLYEVEPPIDGRVPMPGVPGKGGGKQVGALKRPSTARELVLALKENGLIGMWKDRTDIGDNFRSNRPDA